MLEIGLPYLGKNAIGLRTVTSKGYFEVQGLDEYNNANLRNVYVVKVDLLKRLTNHFSEETLRDYRDAVYMIICGDYAGNEIVLQSLKYLYSSDKVFQLKLGTIVYFRDSGMDDLSVYDALLSDVKKSIAVEEDTVMSLIPSQKYICTNKLYSYFSIDENIPFSVAFNSVEMEAVSYVKNWGISKP